MTNVESFMAATKLKAEAMAQKMANLELSIWNKKHESDLKKDFMFTDKDLRDRKRSLKDTANGI